MFIGGGLWMPDADSLKKIRQEIDYNFSNFKEIVLEKKVGNTYIFDVAISHEVKPLLKGNRYSLIWFIQNNHVKVKSNKFL